MKRPWGINFRIAAVAADQFAALRAQLKDLADAPGVYRFYGADDALLYVGKAKSLPKRVRTYFSAATLASPRLGWMVRQIARFEVTCTPSENDALLLEQEQIKALEPKFNVLFRDDSTYPYLKLSKHRVPRLSYYRGPATDECFGPYPNVPAVKESIKVLQRVFQLRTCTDANYAARTRPCLLHQIKRCSAPCVGLVSTERYARDVREARRFVAGDSSSVSKDLARQMEAAAAKEDFEQAAALRDQLKSLADIRRVSAVTGGADNADYVAVHLEGAGAGVRLVSVRNGLLVSELDYHPQPTRLAPEPDEVLAAFLAHHYQRHPAPARVIVRSAMPAAQLQRLAGAERTKFITRPSGAERERLTMAASNAAAALQRRGQAQAARYEAFARLASCANLTDLARIDCLDVSHSMGEAAQAACVVCVGGAMDKASYRRYSLRSTKRGDDYGGLREAIRRRYRDARKRPAVLPGLLVIDGGTGQLSSAAAALAEVTDAEVPLLGIAKGAARKPGTETLLLGTGEELRLAPTDAAFRLLQHMRDEAHRFAIAGHRRLLARKRRASVLELVEGVGPATRRNLLNEFGGLQGLKRASLHELARARGVGTELAERIYRSLHA